MPSPSPTLDLELAEAAYRLKRAAAETSAHDDAWARYRAGPDGLIAWVTECCWTLDPRMGADDKPIGWIPFHPYDFQVDYLRWVEARYAESADSFTEKSRDMGASWCQIYWYLWHWLFDEGFHALVGSYSEAMVDDFLPTSILGRMEEVIDRLPDWQKARARWSRRHPECRKHLKIVNRATGTMIEGQSPNPSFGRGGRFSAILLDEFSRWAWAEQVLASTADATRFRSFVATPRGMNTSGRLRHSGRVKHITLHWRLHPHKDDRWYAAECARRTPEEIAQELDISYERSVEGRVLPEWDRVPSGAFPYVRGWPLYVSWDFGLDDNTAVIWWQRNPATGRYRVVDCYSHTGAAISFYVPFLTGELPSGGPYGYSEAALGKIASHQGWGVATHYGDPAGKQRNQVTGSSVIDELAKHQIYVNTRPDRNTFHERWQTTKLFLGQVEGWDADTCLPLHDSMINARFPARNPDSTHTSENAKPIHDWTSHYRTAVEFFAVNVHGLEEQRAQPKPERQMSAHEHRDWNGSPAARAGLLSKR